MSNTATPSDPASSSSWLPLLEHLAECLTDEGYEDAVTTCRELHLEEDLPSQVKSLVVEIHCKCELHQDHYDEVLSLLRQEEHHYVLDRTLQTTLVAYAHYRMQRFEQARREVRETNNPAQGHIEAQSRYRLHDATSDIYSDLLDTEGVDQQERLQTMVNAVAVVLARATPYVETGELPGGLSADSWISEEPGHDLLYNLGSYELVTSRNTAKGISLLEQAERICVASLEQDGLDASDIASEVAPIQYHAKLWSRQWHGQPSDDEDQASSAALQTIQKVNRALVRYSLTDLPALDPSWTALQQRLYFYNRAVVQLRHKQYAECLRTCQAFIPSTHKKDKTGVKLPPYSSFVDEAWWKAHAVVLQAHAHAPQHPDKAVKLLHDERQHLQEATPSSAVDHAFSHVLLHLAHFEKRLDDPGIMIEVLQELPSSIQHRTGVVATLATLYQDMGNHEKAMQLLEQDQGGAAMIDFYLSQGDYETATKACEASGDKVRLVEALSYIDPEKAQKTWEELDLDDEASIEEELDGAQLEERDLPRRSRKVASLPRTQVLGNTRTKKSQDAILRQRARKKEAYLAKLTSEGKYNPERPTNPDPERWIAKHERSYNRRRRQRHQNKGHQGGGSEKDAAKLDVAARKGEATDVGGLPSTAHLGVAGESKRGGRRR